MCPLDGNVKVGRLGRLSLIASNIAKNLAIAASLPLGYAWLPVSCCCVMPTVRYGMDLDADDDDEPKDGMDRFSLNFAGIVMGFLSTVSCACCLGCCGSRSPKEIYE